MNNNLMSFKKSKSFLDGAISLAFLSFLICSVITLLLLLTDPFGGDYMYLTYKHYSSGTLNQIYNNVSYILAIIFGILAILHLSSFSVSCAALSQKSKELIHASFIIQLISLCIGIVALLLAIFFDYYKESYHIFFLYYLLPTILIFFNIISLLLLYKHWAFGRFYFENFKKLLHERNRQTFENYQTAYGNGLISRQTYETGIQLLKQRKADINSDTNFDEKCVSSSKRKKNISLSLLFVILTISITCMCLNLFERNFMTIYLDEFKQEKALLEEGTQEDEELRQEQIRIENEFLQKLYYHYFSNTEGKYFQIIPDTHNNSAYLKSNLPQHSYSSSYWGHYYDMQKKQFIIYREYYENDRTYDEYIIETIYTKNNLTYVQIYCLADGKMYILSSNYKTN